jgi:DNA-binding phage protein
MTTPRKTGFDRYFAKRMADPKFAAEYGVARAEIDATDKLVRALDAVREAGGLTKADLARRIDVQPEMIRRLLTAPDSNPTMETVFKVASALGCHLELVPNVGRSGARRSGGAMSGRLGFDR